MDPADNHADNQTGFTSLPSGIRDESGIFKFINHNSFYWTSTQVGVGALFRSMGSKWVGVSKSNAIEKNGFSVRCIKDL